MGPNSITHAAVAKGPGGRGRSLPYLPGLDGLRALAVIAVLLYHAELRWIPGGFLGVEVFFVISGYLITSLLLVEWQHTGGTDLKAFWLRRARRLLPALFLLIVAVLAYAVAFLPDEVASLRTDALAASVYVSNWYLIFDHQSYFESVGRPSLLRHLWSLAVEEQFYVLWPLLFVAGMRFLRRRRMLVAMLLGAVASAVLMAVLYQPDVDPSRIYYGTDTRAAGLLIGAALAFVWAPGQSMGRADRLPLDLIGLAALGALFLGFTRIDEFQPFLYQGGFAYVALATAGVIMVVVHPQARFAPRLLGCAPLRWIGLRSYGIYLWHWPIFMVTRPELDVRIEGLPLLVLRFLATGILAELSYRYVETPLRTGALGRAWQELRNARGPRRRALSVGWVTASAAIVVFSVVLGESVVGAEPPTVPSYLAVESIDTLSSATSSSTAHLPSVLAMSEQAALDQAPEPVEAVPAVPGVSATTRSTNRPGRFHGTAWYRWYTGRAARNEPVPTPTAAAVAVISPTDTVPITPTAMVVISPTAAVPVTPTAALPLTNTTPPAPRVTAIGDSVMLGAVKELEQVLGNVEINAAISRQVKDTIVLLNERKQAGQLGSVVVIHVGSNGTFSAQQFDEIMAGVLTDVPTVVFVNVKVPRKWEAPNNTVLAEGVQRYPNARLVDWRAAAEGHPEFFWNDGIHLRPEGAKVYADLIAASINQQQ